MQNASEVVAVLVKPHNQQGPEYIVVLGVGGAGSPESRAENLLATKIGRPGQEYRGGEIARTSEAIILKQTDVENWDRLKVAIERWETAVGMRT